MKSGKLLVVIGIAISLLIAIGVYNRGVKNTTTSSSQDSTVIPNISPAKDETIDWKTYNHPTLGFTLKHPSSYVVLKEQPDRVELGFNDYPYVTITSILEQYNENNICNENTTEYPCVASSGFDQLKPIEIIKVNNIDAKSFYISEGVDAAYHIVQLSGTAPLQLKANIAGGGLDRTFTHILSTVTHQ